MIHYKSGDVLASGCNYICHQVNCRGKMASGIAGQIREKWPVVYNKYQEKYVEAYNWCQGRDSVTPADYLLGDIEVVYVQNNDEGKYQYVINMYGQDAYGYDDNTRYTSYDAFAECLYKIRNHVPKDRTIAFPWGIGCGLGNAHWNIIERMIETILEDHEVYIYAQWMKHINKENKE